MTVDGRVPAASDSALADWLWLTAIVAAVALADFAWLRTNQVPPHWDQANHMLSALSYRHVLMTCFDPAHGVIRSLGHCGRTLVYVDQAVYAPLFALSGGVMTLAAGASVTALAMTNLPFVALLVGSMYGLGRRLDSRLTGIFAALLVCAYPLVFVTSREFMLEFSLLAFTAAAACLLVLSDHFAHRAWSLLFGVAAGLAVLTKFTFLPFIVGPFLFEIGRLVADARHGRLSKREAIRRAETVSAALALAFVIAGVWYLPNRNSFVANLAVVTSLDTVSGTRFSPASLTFYIRAMAWDQMGLPLFALFVLGVFRLRAVTAESRHRLLIWIASIYGITTLVVFKAVANDIGILIPSALVTAVGLASLRRHRRLAMVGVVAFAVAQLAVFSTPRLATGLPSEFVGWSGASTAFPRREDWKLEDVLRSLAPAPARVLVVSDHPFVNGTTAQFYAVRDQLALEISPCWTVPHLADDPNALAGFDFVIATTDTTWARPKSDGCFRGASGRADYEVFLARARASASLILLLSPALPDGSSLLVFSRSPLPRRVIASAG